MKIASIGSLPFLFIAMSVSACTHAPCPSPGESPIIPEKDLPPSVVPLEKKSNLIWHGPASISFYQIDEGIEAQSGVLFVRLTWSDDADFQTGIERIQELLSDHHARIVGQHYNPLELQVFVQYESCVEPLYNLLKQDPIVRGVRFNLPSVQEYNDR